MLNWATTGKSSAKKARFIGDKKLLEGAKTKPVEKEKMDLLDDAKHIDKVVVVDTSTPVKYIKPIHRPRGSDSLNPKKGDS